MLGMPWKLGGNMWEVGGCGGNPPETGDQVPQALSLERSHLFWGPVRAGWLWGPAHPAGGGGVHPCGQSPLDPGASSQVSSVQLSLALVPRLLRFLGCESCPRPPGLGNSSLVSFEEVSLSCAVDTVHFVSSGFGVYSSTWFTSICLPLGIVWPWW